jgi:hypothetical protein
LRKQINEKEISWFFRLHWGVPQVIGRNQLFIR